MTREATKRRRVAYHEAGHVVAAWAEGVALRSATIDPNAHEGYLGAVLIPGLSATSRMVVETDYPRARRLLEPRIVVDLAGGIAERRIAGRHDWQGSLRDREQAADAASYCVMSEGETKPYLDWLWKRAEFQVECHWREIEAVAAALLERQTIRASDLLVLIRTTTTGGTPDAP